MQNKFNMAYLEGFSNGPVIWRYGLFVLCGAFVLCLGYAFDMQSQLAGLRQSREQEFVLHQLFEYKEQEVLKLSVYQAQIQAMTINLSQMLQNFPSKTELPFLLEEISHVGLDLGLKFELFKPLEQEDKVFYIQRAVKISLTGQYHALAYFVSQVAHLKQLIILGDFILKPVDSTLDAGNSLQKREPEELNLTMIASTYRYVEEHAI
jgi:type IV pilus assembly protein PilO